MAHQSATTTTRLPNFGSPEEAGEFWDTHSPEDFPEEFTEADVQFDRPLIKRGLTVKLSEDTIARLRKLAEAQGIGPSTLVRMWILERLHQGTAAPRSSQSP